MPMLRSLVLTLAMLSPTASVGDCVKDSAGEVFCGAGSCAFARGGRPWCSRYDDGGVDRARSGEIVCGKGACARTSDGSVFCSSVEGGAVTKDSRGRVRCEGRCERATAEHCESTVAGSSR